MFSKEKIRSFTCGFLISSLLFSTIAVFAEAVEKQITAVYNDIKLIVDGKKIIPKDPNGNVVEPFIYDGTTYLPVRAVAQALGKEVSWDGDTKTIYIGKSPINQPDSNKIETTDVTLTKEGFAKSVSPLTNAPIDRTKLFDRDARVINYVVKFDSVSSNFIMNFEVLYNLKADEGLKFKYNITKDFSGRYLNFYLNVPEGQKLPAGDYTLVVYGIKDGNEIFKFEDTCQVE